MEAVTEQLDLLQKSIDAAQIEHFNTPTAAQSGESNGHLLVVDDDPDFLLFISKILIQHGFRVTTTTEPENVPTLIADSAPGLLLVDAKCRE